MRIGYARVSTLEQSLDVQIAQLLNAGCEFIYQEKRSGKDTGRPELQKLLLRLRPLDVLVVCKLDRLARSTSDLLGLIGQITQVHAGLLSLAEPWADTTSPAGKLMVTVLAGFAQFERERMMERAAEGRRLARSRGKHLGRKSSLSFHQQQEVLAMLKAGERSTADIGRTFGVHVATINRLRRRTELLAAGGGL